MEKEAWIAKVMDSTKGLKTVEPSDVIWSKIQKQIKQHDKVSAKTVWLVAASITVLVVLNITILKSKARTKVSDTTPYLEVTINQSNQLYQ